MSRLPSDSIVVVTTHIIIGIYYICIHYAYIICYATCIYICYTMIKFGIVLETLTFKQLYDLLYVKLLISIRLA